MLTDLIIILGATGALIAWMDWILSNVADALNDAPDQDADPYLVQVLKDGGLLDAIRRGEGRARAEESGNQALSHNSSSASHSGRGLN